MLAEIAEQPDAVRRAAAALHDQRSALSSLPHPAGDGTLVVFTGMGASYDACYPAINELAARGIAALLVDTAELLHFRKSILERGALVVAVSQSGESAEVVGLVAELRARGRRPFIVSITNGVHNQLARGADVALDTRAGEETGPSTKTFAASLVTLSGIARLLAGRDPDVAATETLLASERAAAAIEALLRDAEIRAENLASWQKGRDIVVLLGRGSARAAAEMGALLLKEAAGLPAESLEAAQFRHGPLELAGPAMAAVIVAVEAETRRLDLRLADGLVQAGSAVLVVTPDGAAPPGAWGIATGYIDRSLFAAGGIVPVQLLAWRLAVEQGRTPGLLNRATKVTTSE
jgi:glutamine---fructose-6-phosphate transaminase (isomerizing)